MKTSALRSFRPVILSVLHIVTAYLFLLHGMTKFLSFSMSMGGVSKGLMLVAGILEIVGDVLLILGLFIRPSMFVLSGQMAVVYFMAYMPSGNVLSPLADQGESAVLFCFMFLYPVVVGDGAWTLDSVFGKDKD